MTKNEVKRHHHSSPRAKRSDYLLKFAIVAEYIRMAHQHIDTTYTHKQPSTNVWQQRN